MKKIAVIGSLNMDFVIKTAQIPKPGETVKASELGHIPGGKGANQAYAVGKLGGNVEMIGAIGTDSFGETMLSNLQSVGVGVSGVEKIDSVNTGQAYIAVEDSGQNSIIVVAGANAKVDKTLIDKHMDVIEKSDIIIMQFEIPLETVAYIKNIALEKNKLIILDPAPAVPNLPNEFWKGIDYIKPNETELEILIGKKVKTEDDLINGARELLEKGVKNVLVTLGEKGCLFMTGGEEKLIPAEKVKAVDATAAGDSFTAAFALSLSQDYNVEEAIAFGQKVSGIVVTRKGAQTSIPSKEEL